jgi:fructokinase
VDLDWLKPGDGSLSEKARQVMAQGPAMVVVTRGGAGAMGFLQNEIEVSVPSQRVTVVDTVGAGDTFNAGLLAKLSELGRLDKAACATMTADDAKAALTHGAAVAAVTVSRAGANPPWASELTG